jgi:thiamine-monophosphate kinase
MTALGPGGEFDRLRAAFGKLGARLVGAGDDAALVTVDGVDLALSCDLAIEGQHFRLAWLSAREIGWRAGASALSDLAAVAADPLGVLAAVGVPEGRDGEFFQELMLGIADAAALVDAVVWGGDLVRAPQVTVDVSVVGRAAHPVRRSGARSGEGLWVSGWLGAPRAAIQAWERGETPAAALRERFAHPVPRVREAVWLRAQGASAMIDISDGLVGDAGHLAAASGVALEIDARRVPMHSAILTAQAVEADALVTALTGGEEYELLAALPATFDDARAAVFREQFAVPLTRIGDVVAGSGVTVLRDGKPFAVAGGYSHF